MSVNENQGPSGRVFAVADTPYCCWDWDLRSRTLEFLDGLDQDYSGDIAEILGSQLGSEKEFAAAITLRVAYQQSLETLMSLLGAHAQAPLAVPAWIAKCSTADLLEVVTRLRAGSPLLTQVGRRRVSFDDLSADIHRHVWVDETGGETTATRFARLWGRLANEFLDEVARAEYNALKHGNRVQAGGFTLAIGTEDVPGLPAPPENMRSLGGSRFGSTFHVAERAGSSKSHIRMRRTSVNWSPDAMAQRLALVALSIANVVGSLRCALGVDPTSVQFHRPIPASAFDDVWKADPGLKHSTMDALIELDPSDEVPASRLIEILEQLGATQSPTAE